MGRKWQSQWNWWADEVGLRVRGTESLRPMFRGEPFWVTRQLRVCPWLRFSKTECPLPTPPVWLKPIRAPYIPSPWTPCFSHSGLQWFCPYHISLPPLPFPNTVFLPLKLQFMFSFPSKVLTNVSSLNVSPPQPSPVIFHKVSLGWQGFLFSSLECTSMEDRKCEPGSLHSWCAQQSAWFAVCALYWTR